MPFFLFFFYKMCDQISEKTKVYFLKERGDFRLFWSPRPIELIKARVKGPEWRNPTTNSEDLTVHTPKRGKNTFWKMNEIFWNGERRVWMKECSQPRTFRYWDFGVCVVTSHETPPKRFLSSSSFMFVLIHSFPRPSGVGSLSPRLPRDTIQTDLICRKWHTDVTSRHLHPLPAALVRQTDICFTFSPCLSNTIFFILVRSERQKRLRVFMPFLPSSWSPN